MSVVRPATLLRTGTRPAATILPAATPTQLNEVRALMRANLAWHRECHAEDDALTDRWFAPQHFEAELAGLPGAYATQQKGALLLAYNGGRAAGCVALRGLGDGLCELKRLFVPLTCRGLGIGRLLTERMIATARALGHRRLRLDCSLRQVEAMRLFVGTGFTRIAPYYTDPDDLPERLAFFEKTLA
ncbi:MAG: GNAT family N-acetyltransferase [Ferrovibrio sp.]|uniref:GNAT family N-acetyltransferase n=1 Tax=Ferrovibrio sp. TaxID=1917215 RepID=UPI00260B6F1B|nr:GNAT family N-acetyltransferase [Ferrovibrio sp.]MCW0236408.1 GNAT family N-acetyltransferase [Ferrovibrio sp.]